MLRNLTRLAIAALVVGLALTVVYIPEGQLAVRESYGGAAQAMSAGLGFRLPLYQRIYRYDTLPVAIDEPVQVITRDSGTFQLPITIAAWVSPGDLVTFHRGRTGRDT